MLSSDFYFFDCTYEKKYVALSLDNSNWDRCCRLILGKETDVFDIYFRQISGKTFSDVLNPASVGLFVVSERLISVLKSGDFSGWNALPIKLFDKNGAMLSGYFCLSVTGRSGPLSFENSQIFKKRYMENAPEVQVFKGVRIEADSCGGCDIFVPEGTLHIVVSGKLAEVLRKSCLTNLSLLDFEEYEYPKEDL